MEKLTINQIKAKVREMEARAESSNVYQFYSKSEIERINNLINKCVKTIELRKVEENISEEELERFEGLIEGREIPLDQLLIDDKLWKYIMKKARKAGIKKHIGRWLIYHMKKRGIPKSEIEYYKLGFIINHKVSFPVNL